MEIIPLYNFQIAETNHFIKSKKYIPENLYHKIINIVYPLLRTNPFYGTNIRKLKGKMEGYYRYRIGNYRLFYLVENEKVLVVVVDFRHRQGAYENNLP